MNDKKTNIGIQTRKDLKFYLNEDHRRNNVSKNVFRYYLGLLAGLENTAAYRYIKCLRHLEYHLNNSNRSPYHKYYKFLQSRLGMNYFIGNNVFVAPMQ